MAFIPVPGTARLELRFTHQGSQMENVLWFTGTTVTQTELDLLTTTMAQWWYDHYRPIQSNHVILREVYARMMDHAADIESSNVTFSGDQGAITEEALPGNCTLCFSLRTGYTGRSSRGRLYSVGMTESQQNNGIAASGYITAMQGALEQIPILMASIGTWDWVVVSLYHDGHPRSTGQKLNITDIIVVDDAMDSQRRRLPNRGR